MELKNAVAVITGAGSGIGRELALQLADVGAELAVNDHNPDLLAETTTEVASRGGTVFARSFDVSDRAAMDEFSNDVRERFNRVDVMVNNAGVALGDIPLEEVSHEDFHWLMNVNLWGVVYGTTAFLPLLRERSEQHPEAGLVNICSSFGLLAVPGQVPYCTSKFAVRGFTESLRLELIDTNIRVTLVCPSQVKTNILRHGRHKSEEQKAEIVHKFETYMANVTAEEAAAAIIDGVKRNKKQILIGRSAKQSAFASRFLPRFVIEHKVKKVLKQLAGL